MELPPGLVVGEHTALLRLFLWGFCLLRLGVLLAGLSRRDATTPAVFLLGQQDHLLSSRFPVSFVFVFRRVPVTGRNCGLPLGYSHAAGDSG